MVAQINRPCFDQIKTWLKAVEGQTKQASAKKAEPNEEVDVAPSAKKDPGGHCGATSHPSKSIDDGTQDAPEGSRARENEADVKKDVPASVDETKPGSGGTQEERQMQIGTHKSETGMDPKVEDDYKSKKDDPGTTHPAKATVGEKYSSLNELLAMHKKASDELLAAISVNLTPTTPETIKKASTESTKSTGLNDAAQAGYKLAAVAQNQDQLTSEAVLGQIIKEAYEDADRVGPFMIAYLAEREKIATEVKKAGPDGAPEPPPDAAAAMGGGGPPPDAGAPPDAGGPPPEMGGGAGGPPGAGGGGQEQALQELAMALMELGVSPEELAQIAQAMSGAGGPPGGGMMPPGAGGPPPDMGAPPPGAGGPPPGSPAEMGAKVASAVKDFQRSGKFRVEAAKTAAQREYRDRMKSYILEIVGNR